jgi:hypothetical protein
MKQPKKTRGRRTPVTDAKTEMAYRIMKNQLPLYRKVEDKVMFSQLNRNLLFDITNVDRFKTKWISEKAKANPDLTRSWDHVLQRSSITQKIFEEMDRNPQMTLGGFIRLLNKYCSQVLLTKEEHKQVTGFTQNKDELNFEIYWVLGIKMIWNNQRGRKKDFYHEMEKNFGHLKKE